MNLPFPILCDPELKLIKQLGMLHEDAGGKGVHAARPATYVVERGGHVVWFRTYGNVRTRPDPNDILAAVKAIPRN